MIGKVALHVPTGTKVTVLQFIHDDKAGKTFAICHDTNGYLHSYNIYDLLMVL